MRRPWRSWIILFFIVAALLVSGYRIGERQGLLVSMILVIALVSYVSVLIKDLLISAFSAEELEGRDPWNLQPFVNQLSKDIKIKTPRIFLMPEETATGVILGRARSKSALVLSRGAVEQLGEDERNALIGFLLCQVRRGDTLALALGQSLGFVILFPALVVDKTISLLLRSKTEIDFFERIFAPLSSVVIRLIVGRQIYFDTDREAADLMRNPEVLARTLWKLESWATSKPLQVPASTAHLFIVNPLTSKNWNRYFRSQPPVAKRIQALIGRYPI